MDKFNQAYNAMIQLLIEDSQQKTVGYHATDVSPEIILKNGLLKGKEGHTNFEVIGDIEKYLPSNRVYLSKNVQAYQGKYHYKVDITGIKKYPDYGALPDVGAYMEESSFWFKSLDKVKNKRFKEVLKDNDREIAYDDFDGEDSWEFLGSCVVEGPIPPERIRLLEKDN